VGAQFGEEARRLVQVRAVGRIADGHLPVAATGGGVPVEDGTDSTLTVSLLVGTRSALIPGNNVSMLLLRVPQKLAEIVVVSLKALQ
jgi:hypothetical protein